MQNQAAKFDDRESEVRTEKPDAELGQDDTKLCGQLYIKFQGSDGASTFVRSASGYLVRKIDDATYVVLTAAHNFKFAKDGEDLELIGGFFILQRSGKGVYAARFNFEGEDP